MDSVRVSRMSSDLIAVSADRITMAFSPDKDAHVSYSVYCLQVC